MKIDISHIAKLANLPLKKEEKEKFEAQLVSILEYFKKLTEIDTSKVKETSQVTDTENVVREDEPSPSLSQEETLSNAKLTHNGFFKVKAILDEGKKM